MALLPSAEKRLSPVELDELDLRDKDFVTGKTEEGIAEYLKSALGPWQTISSKLESAEKGSPFLLIICASAQRAVDLIRELAPLQEKTKVAKLFAKHFKIEAQVLYLASHMCNIAVGTPNRIFHLIQKDGLKVNCLKYFIIDWTWQDKKQRTIAKIPELMQDLAVLLSSHILPLTKQNQVQIGLY
ncbi:uncharacterized protein C3orf26 homolog [Oscarella lobularis]|uniref:uncharacterized protein C3orf26 homolog n=1 Tax=Oscarella lobularis TaxID=121494 RepID=UPI00331377F6